MEQDLTKIIHELSVHETQLKSDLDQLTAKTKAITGRLLQIQSAMAALRGTGKVKQIKIEDKHNRQAPAQSEIEEIILKILREKKSVPIVELMQQVKSLFLANGQSRLGLKPLFAKALASPKFKIDQSQNVSLSQLLH